jgi:hypothetical protein
MSVSENTTKMYGLAKTAPHGEADMNRTMVQTGVSSDSGGLFTTKPGVKNVEKRIRSLWPNTVLL